MRAALDEIEKQLVTLAVEESDGTYMSACKLLGLGQATDVRHKMRRHGIPKKEVKKCPQLVSPVLREEEPTSPR